MCTVFVFLFLSIHVSTFDFSCTEIQSQAHRQSQVMLLRLLCSIMDVCVWVF